MVCHAVCPPQRAAAAAASKWTTGRGNLSGWTAEEKLDAAVNVVVRHMLGGTAAFHLQWKQLAGCPTLPVSSVLPTSDPPAPVHTTHLRDQLQDVPGRVSSTIKNTALLSFAHTSTTTEG